MKKLLFAAAAISALSVAAPSHATTYIGTGGSGSVNVIGNVSKTATIAAPAGATIGNLIVTLNGFSTTNLQELLIVLTHNAQTITLSPTSFGAIFTPGGVNGTYSFSATSPTSLVAGDAPGTYKYFGSITGAVAGAYTLSVTDVFPDRSRTSFKSFSVQVSSVPEPMTWAMMLAGFGLIGGVMRRRRSEAGTGVLATA